MKKRFWRFMTSYWIERSTSLLLCVLVHTNKRLGSPMSNRVSETTKKRTQGQLLSQGRIHQENRFFS